MKSKIQELVDKFLKSPSQSETEVRTKFVIPLFDLLKYPSEIRSEEFPVYGHEGGKAIHAKSSDILFFDSKEFPDYREREDVKWVYEHSLVVVEIKKRGESIEVQGQAIYYASWTRTSLYVITNGEKIAFYKVNSNYSDEKVLECNIEDIANNWDIINNVYNYEKVIKDKKKNSYFNKDYENSRYSEYCNELIFLISNKIDNSITRYIEKDDKNYFSNKLLNSKNNNSEGIEYNKILELTNNILILSEPGGGKSFLLNILLRDYLLNNKEVDNRVPVIINSSYFKQLFSNIEEAIYQQISPYNQVVTIESVKEDIENGKFFILIDAIDEVKKDRIIYIEMIRKLAIHTKNRIIVTSRKENYNYELNNEFDLYSIKLLNKEQIDLYLRKNTNEQISLLRLNLDERFIKLLSTPLYLFMTLQVIRNTRDYKIPANKSKLFEIYFKYPLNEKLNRPQINLLEKILSEYAEFLFYNKESEDELFKIITKYVVINDYEKYYELIIKSGLLITGENGLVFFHKTFLEYFYAKKISNYDKEEIQLFLKDKIYDVSFVELICFLVGIISDSNKQNYVLDYLEKNNLNLFIRAVNSRYKFSKSSINEEYIYTKEYLQQLRSTYINIISCYFSEIAGAFSPYIDIKTSDIKVIGKINCSEESIYVKFEAADKNSQTVEFYTIEGKPKMYDSNNKPLGAIYSIRNFDGGSYFDLNLLSYGLDSSREISLLIIKDRLKDIIDKKIYAFDIGNRILMSELIEYYLKKLRKSNLLPKELDNISIYNSDIELINKLFFNYKKYEGIGLKDGRMIKIPFGLLYCYSSMLIDKKDDLRDLLTIPADIDYKNLDKSSYYETDLYSDATLVMAIERILILVNNSYRNVVESKFYNLRNYMYNYCNNSKSLIWINRNEHGGNIVEIKLKQNNHEINEPMIFIGQEPPKYGDKNDCLNDILYNEGKTREDILTWSSGWLLQYFDENMIHKIVYKLIGNDLDRIFNS